MIPTNLSAIDNFEFVIRCARDGAKLAIIPNESDVKLALDRIDQARAEIEKMDAAVAGCDPDSDEYATALRDAADAQAHYEEVKHYVESLSQLAKEHPELIEEHVFTLRPYSYFEWAALQEKASEWKEDGTSTIDETKYVPEVLANTIVAWPYDMPITVENIGKLRVPFVRALYRAVYENSEADQGRYFFRGVRAVGPVGRDAGK